ALESAVECRRATGERVKEGDALRRLGDFLWCPGRTVEAARLAHEAVELLETLPPGRELAFAYVGLAANHSRAARAEEAVAWGSRAVDLAEKLGEEEIAVEAELTIASSQRDLAKLEDQKERARLAGLDEKVAFALMLLTGVAHANRRLELGVRYA